MKHFEGLQNQEYIKARYKELAKKNHPDLGGCVEVMKEINDQYEKCMMGFYQNSNEIGVDEFLKDSKEFADKLRNVIFMSDLIVEICGCWIWVTGNTKSFKDKLKESGFIWAPKKLAWYWRKPEDKKKFQKRIFS